MRERLKDAGETAKRVGITPAYAGKTRGLGIRRLFRRDHPRVCGKDTKKQKNAKPMTGSPPRMRERQSLLYALRSQYGITPAYAGKTISFVILSLMAWDHPRVCGKDILLSGPRVKLKGSPPRMRERLFS